jgi:cytochrome c|uniref:C-type cytochrome, putative n=1 Tax=Chlorobium chlorochromatii (strain CaD3) TaxID=340177 RepID=Q3AS46_CHLCH
MKKMFLISIGMVTALPLLAADGKAIFERSCAACHSVMPPPKAAPPIMPLAFHYQSTFKSKEEGVKHMAAFLKNPDKAKAIDQQAIQRFGIMPAQALSDEELKAVAEWVWDQYNPASGMGRMGGMRGQGQRWQQP